MSLASVSDTGSPITVHYVNVLPDSFGVGYREILQRFEGSPHLAPRRMYALPPSLLNSIVGHLPRWLSAEDQRFEQELAELCQEHGVVGVVHGKPVSHDLLKPVALPQLTREQFNESGFPPEVTYERWQLSLRVAGERLEPMQLQLQAYMGWLVTNPEFLGEVTRIAANDHHPPAYLGTPGYADFLNRWQLLGMASWELPNPAGPNLSGTPWPESICTGTGQVHLSVPMTMRLPARYPLRRIQAEVQRQGASEHLRGWLNVLDRDGARGTGLRRYRQMLFLHFYLNIVLRSRYGDRMPRVAMALDEVFGDFHQLSAESTKRLRLAVARRLSE